MVRVEYHIGLNIGLNFALFLLIWSTFNTSIFSFNEYRVTLESIWHKITYEDFPADVEISFSKFEKFACPKTSNPDVLTLCSNVLSLEISGFIYKLGCYLTFCSIFISISNLFLLLLHRRTFLSKLEPSHYTTPACYWIFVLIYFILSNSESMVSPTDEEVSVTFEKGSFWMFSAGGLSLIILALFLFMKKFLDYDELINNCADTQLASLLDLKSVGLDRDNEIIAQQEQDLKVKEREISELQQKIMNLEKIREESGSEASVKISAKKKVKLRAGKGEQYDTIEGLKEELGNLRRQYGMEKHELEAEIAKLKEHDNTDYYVGLVNELCGKIEDLRTQLSEKEGAEEEKKVLGRTLEEIKGEVDGFKKQNMRERKERDLERNQTQQIIKSLELEIEKKNRVLAQQANIDVLKSDNERLSEELVRTEMAKKHLSEKLTEMGEKIAKLEKNLLFAQEDKHNLDLANSELKHLKSQLASRQEDIDKQVVTIKALKEALNEKENRIEEFENICKFSENKIRKTNEQLEELRKDQGVKELMGLKEKDEFKVRLEGKEEEIKMLSGQIIDLEKELEVVRKSAHAEKSEEYANLKEEAEILENKVSSLNNMVKKQRENNSKLELDLENSVQAKEHIEKKWAQSKETVEHQKVIIDDLSSKAQELLDLHKAHNKALEVIQTLQNQVDSLNLEIQQLKEALRLLESSKKEKDFYEGQYQNSLKELESLNSKARKLELENVLLSNLQSENSALHEQINHNNTSLDQARQQLNEFRATFNTRESEHEREKDELLYTLNKSKKELQNLEKQQKTQEDYLTNEIENIQREKESLEDTLKNLNSQNEVFKREIDRLENMQKFYKNQSDLQSAEIAALSEGQKLKHSFDGEKKAFEGQIENIKKSLAEANRNLQQVLEEKDYLRKDLASTQNELQQVSEEYANLQNQVYHERKASGGQDYAENMMLSPLSNRSLESSARSAQDFVIIESMVPAYGNAILDNVSKLKKEPPMTYKNVWKLFEDIMTDKCKMDRLELAMGRQPRTMTEYMLDFVYLQYGLKSLALRQLKSLIASLEVLYKQGHPYGTLFCRFLGLFHPRPLSFQISIYLLIVQEKFLECSSKLKEKKPANFSQAYEIMQYGGQASIIDLLDLIQKICRNNREVGERIITAMHKERPDRVELSILKICGCMARMGKTSDFIFEILNAERRGPGLEYQEFIDGVRYTLNIWVTQEEAEDLCRYIDNEDTGYITFDSWYQKVNFVEFAEKMYSKVAMITKSDFLNALVDEYEREIVDDYRVLKSLIRYPVLNQNSMATFLLQLDPNLDEEDIFRLYDEAREQGEQSLAGISPHSVCVVVLKHNIGGYGVGMFDVYDLDLEQPKTSTEGVRTELVVERNNAGRLEIDLRRRNK